MVTVALADKLTVEVQLKQTVGPLRGAALGRLRSVVTVCFRPEAAFRGGPQTTRNGAQSPQRVGRSDRLGRISNVISW